MYNCLINSGFKIKNLLVLQKGQKGGNGDLQAQYANDCELLIYANKGRRKFNKTQLVKTDGRKGSKPYRTRLSNVWFDTNYNTYPKATVNISNQKGKIIHPTEKNIKLIEWFLLISSNEGDVVLDPFLGSGTTVISAINTNRNFIGIEKDENYYCIAKQRVDDLQMA
jgi:DNA modification methylase